MPEDINTNTTKPGESLSQYLQRRLVSSDENLGVLRNDFVEEVLRKIRNILNLGQVDESIVTVRSSFRDDSLFLRPVYSGDGNKPSERLDEFLRKPLNQKPFALKKDEAFEHLLWVHSDDDNHKQPDRRVECFVAQHKVGAPRNIQVDADKNHKSFAHRIDRFVRAFKEEALKEAPILSTKTLETVDACFFAGKNKEPGKNGANSNDKNEIELKHILAIYHKNVSFEPALEVSVKDQLLECSRELFNGLELISKIDATRFQTQGLKMVSDLLPQFLRQHLAPADKISFAIVKLQQLVQSHLIGRNGGGKAPKVFFVAATFENYATSTEETVLRPRLEVYPHVYREKYLNTSYFITHRAMPSATKFLLMRYLLSQKHHIVEIAPLANDDTRPAEKTKITLAPDFISLFDNLNTRRPIEEWQNIITPSKDPDFLYMSRGNGEEGEGQSKESKLTPFEALNKSDESQCQSIAAFILEGREIEMENINDESLGKKKRSDKNERGKESRRVKCLPRGVFAIESDYEDGFSDEDIASLRVVFQGLASLFRHISHQNAPIDYRARIRSTFSDDVDSSHPPTGREAMTDFLFYTQKLHYPLFKELVDRCAIEPKKYGVTKTIAGELQQICKELDIDIEKTGEREQSEERLLVMGRFLKGRTGPLSIDLLNFLGACPESYTWSSYFACMAQALGDRIDGGKQPEFRRMLPGFSAPDMYMVIVQAELRQVVKLSSYKKLDDENKAYRSWVRYRLVNAARIPYNGFAFETAGSCGQKSAEDKHSDIHLNLEDKEKPARGVLVSDLVSGETGKSGADRVSTLLDLIAEMLGPNPSSACPKFDDIREQLASVFSRNARLWNRDAIENSSEYKNSLDAKHFENEALYHSQLRNLFRLPEKDSPEARKLGQSFSRLGEMKFKKGSLNFYEMSDFVFNRCLRRTLTTADIKACVKICHGDLNPRNLTWSAGLETFFLIDFERVGPKFNGCDQIRLVVSLLASLQLAWTAINDDEDNRSLENLFAYIEDGQEYLTKIFKQLCTSSGGTRDDVIEFIRHTGFENPKSISNDREKDKLLIATLVTIMGTIGEAGVYTNKSWHTHWAMMLFHAASQEYNYSCRNTRTEVANEVINDVMCNFVEPGSLNKLHLGLHKKFKSENPRARLNQVGGYMRHFVTARLVLMFHSALGN